MKKEKKKDSEYVFHRSVTSYFFDYFLRPYIYEPIAFNLIPEWIHPNMLTEAGMLLCIFHYLILGFFSNWFMDISIIPCGLSFFIYQTLDNIDGIHARNIGLGSKIGECFDHAVDNLAGCFCGMVLGQIVLGGPDLDNRMWWTLFANYWVQMSALSIFYESCITGFVRVGFRLASIDEAELLYTMLLIFEGLFPRYIFNLHFTLFGFDLHVGNILMFEAVVIPIFYLNIAVMYTAYKHGKFWDSIIHYYFPVGLIQFLQWYYSPLFFAEWALFAPQICILGLQYILRHLKEDYQILWPFSLSICLLFYYFFQNQYPWLSPTLSNILFFGLLVVTLYKLKDKYKINAIWWVDSRDQKERSRCVTPVNNLKNK